MLSDMLYFLFNTLVIYSPQSGIYWLRDSTLSCSLLGRTAHAQDDTQVGAIDNGGRTAFADERQRLPGYGKDTHGHSHVDEGLGDKHQRQAHDKEGREVAFASSGYPGCPEQ